MLVGRGIAKRQDVPQVDSSKSEVGSQSSTAKTEEKGISNALREDLGGYRQQAAKAALVDQPAIALDVLYYSICMQVLNEDFWIGRNLLSSTFCVHASTTSKDDLGDSPATIKLNNSKSRLDTEWMAIEGEGARFDAFCALTKRAKERLITYCVAASLTINARGSSEGQDHLVDLLEVPFREFWNPTKENYFSRLSIPLLSSVFGSLRNDDWAAWAANNKKGVVVEDLEEWFSCPDAKEAQQWIPAEF